MDWKKLLGSIRASVDEEVRLRNAYLAAENRILCQQICGRVQLTDSDRKALAEIGKKLGRQALEEIAYNLSYATEPEKHAIAEALADMRAAELENQTRPEMIDFLDSFLVSFGLIDEDDETDPYDPERINLL